MTAANRAKLYLRHVARWTRLRMEFEIRGLLVEAGLCRHAADLKYRMARSAHEEARTSPQNAFSFSSLLLGG